MYKTVEEGYLLTYMVLPSVETSPARNRILAGKPDVVTGKTLPVLSICMMPKLASPETGIATAYNRLSILP